MVCPSTQFTYQKGLGIRDVLLCVSHRLQSALESGREARIVQIDFIQPLIGSTIREFSISYALGCCRFCVAYIDTVSTKLS